MGGKERLCLTRPSMTQNATCEWPHCRHTTEGGLSSLVSCQFVLHVLTDHCYTRTKECNALPRHYADMSFQVLVSTIKQNSGVSQTFFFCPAGAHRYPIPIHTPIKIKRMYATLGYAAGHIIVHLMGQILRCKYAKKLGRRIEIRYGCDY